MSIIQPEGLFSGDRLRQCSNLAQLHWPRLYLAADGFGRLEINYAKILRAYATFDPVPTEEEILALLAEFADNFLLFIYEVSGKVWGQWDTAPENLPRYKTTADRKSPAPSIEDFTAWRKRYSDSRKGLPKTFGKFAEAFPKSLVKYPETFHADAYGVGVEKGLSRGGVEEGRRGVGVVVLNPPDEFETWVESVLLRHPKSKHRTLAEQALVRLATGSGFNRSEFDRVHIAWCNTKAWIDKDGSFAPSLAEWIGDRGYLKMPPSAAVNDTEWLRELDEEVAR